MSLVHIDDIDISTLSLDNDAERTSSSETAEPRKSIAMNVTPAKKKGFVSRFLARFGKPQAAPEDLPQIVLEPQAVPGHSFGKRFIVSERRRFNHSSLYAVSAGI